MPSGNITFDLPLSVNVDYTPPVTINLLSNSQILAIGEPVVYEIKVANPKQFAILVDNFTPTNVPGAVASDVSIVFSTDTLTIPAGEQRTTDCTITALATLAVQNVEFILNVTADADAAP